MIFYFSQFQSDPEDIQYSFRISMYLVLIKELCFSYSKSNENFKYFVDADWTNYPNFRKSILSYCTFVYGNTILLKSKKRFTVTLSTMDIEIVILFEATI